MPVECYTIIKTRKPS